MNEIIIELLKRINETRGIDLPLDVDVFGTYNQEELTELFTNDPVPNAVWVIDNVQYELRLNVNSLVEQKLYLKVGEDDPILVTQSSWAVDQYDTKETERLFGCYQAGIAFIQNYTHHHLQLKAETIWMEEVKNNPISDFAKPALTPIENYEQGVFGPVNLILSKGYDRMASGKEPKSAFKTVSTYLNESDEYAKRYALIVEKVQELRDLIDNTGFIKQYLNEE